MHLGKLSGARRLVLPCSLFLNVLSFDLPAALYKVTDNNNAGTSFYFLSDTSANGHEVPLDIRILQQSDFQAEPILASELTEIDSVVFSVSGGANLSGQDDLSEASREISENMLPAFRGISATLQHPEFRNAVRTDTEEHEGMLYQDILMETPTDLSRLLNEISTTANGLKKLGWALDWSPRLPYVYNGQTFVVRLAIRQVETSSEASASTDSEPPTTQASERRQVSFNFLAEIQEVFTRAVDHIPVTRDFSLPERLNSILSTNYATALAEGRLIPEDLTQSRDLYLRTEDSNGASTSTTSPYISIAPRHFIWSADFHAPEDAQVEIPQAINDNRLSLMATLDRDTMPIFAWHCAHESTQRLPSQGVVRITFNFTYYPLYEARMSLTALQDSLINSDEIIRSRLTHWEPMRIHSFTAAEFQSRQQIQSENSQDCSAAEATPTQNEQRPSRIRERVRAFFNDLFWGRNTEGQQHTLRAFFQRTPANDGVTILTPASSDSILTPGSSGSGYHRDNPI